MNTEPLPLKRLYIGKSDGKHEIEIVSEEDFEQGFFLPENVDSEEILTGHRFLIVGHRGTGKTTLLRWLGIQASKKSMIPFFLLFKSEISEEIKAKYSVASGIKEIALTPSGYSVFQDFKDVWRLVLIARICEQIIQIKECVEDLSAARAILSLLGYQEKTPGIFGYLPNLLKNFKIKIMDPGTGFEYEAGVSPDKTKKEYTPGDLARYVSTLFSNLKFRSQMLFLVDEIEVFFKSSEQYNRDMSLVRDLVLVVDELNREFKRRSVPIKIVCAVRGEILNAIGSLGEEISKIVTDYGVDISWHKERRGIDHPLLRMMWKKLNVRYDQVGQQISKKELFPDFIYRMNWYDYLIDHSFSRPRNLINRLSLIQAKFPDETRFTVDQFELTEGDYSRQVLQELEYSMAARYSRDVIEGVKLSLHSRSISFDIAQFSSRLAEIKEYHPDAAAAVRGVGLEAIFRDLFYFGAIGNTYYDNDLRKRIHLWAYRDEPYPRLDKTFVVHRSLRAALSIH